jgi:hypothetical protein
MFIISSQSWAQEKIIDSIIDHDIGVKCGNIAEIRREIYTSVERLEGLEGKILSCQLLDKRCAKYGAFVKDANLARRTLFIERAKLALLDTNSITVATHITPSLVFFLNGGQIPESFSDTDAYVFSAEYDGRIFSKSIVLKDLLSWVNLTPQVQVRLRDPYPEMLIRGTPGALCDLADNDDDVLLTISQPPLSINYADIILGEVRIQHRIRTRVDLEENIPSRFDVSFIVEDLVDRLFDLIPPGKATIDEFRDCDLNSLDAHIGSIREDLAALEVMGSYVGILDNAIISFKPTSILGAERAGSYFASIEFMTSQPRRALLLSSNPGHARIMGYMHGDKLILCDN